jgi:N-dimethylarginine dimethylaminohydrolase
MEVEPGSLSEVGRLTRVLVKHARDAFGDAGSIAAQWKELNFTAPPDFHRAVDEYDRFLDIIRSTGARIEMLSRHGEVGLDSIYVRDASVVCGRGLILCNMGKPQRAGEPADQATALQALEPPIPLVGAIQPPGHLEGGDVVWLDSRTVAVGRGYRTNDEGIRQFRRLLGDSIDELLVVPLPHWRGSSEVLHLMSLLSPIDRDLAVVHSPLMSVPFRERLEQRGVTLVDVPDSEFETMAANVLALAPRRCLMLAGSPRTRVALENAGAEVFEYKGEEISIKGAGGPTCLTRPLSRASPEA